MGKMMLTADVRPPKTAIIIPMDIDEESFREIIKFTCYIWGGKFACFVPFDIHDAKNEVAYSWLEAYSPDIILCENYQISELIQKNIEKITDPPLRIISMRKLYRDSIHLTLPPLAG
ncbi:hypothetical protein [Desulfocurvus sp. DL9XJH121]